MPPIPAKLLSPDQWKAVEEIVATRRGELIGPFIPALRSPEFTRRLQRLGEYLRYDAALPPKLREMAILLTARHWTQHFEWYVHAPIAQQAGVRAETIKAIAARRRPDAMEPAEAIVYDFLQQLHLTQSVNDVPFSSSTYRPSGACCGAFCVRGNAPATASVANSWPKPEWYWRSLAMGR